MMFFHINMLRFGIHTQDQFMKAGKRRRFLGARVSYGLLNIGTDPTEDQVRTFEDISFTLQTSNGTYRTTFRNRLRNVDAATTEILRGLYPRDAELFVQDRAVSHGLTSLEWARQLLQIFPSVRFEASDTLLCLIQLELASGEKYILEPDGQALQYVSPPFVVGLFHEESPALPVNRFVAARAKRRLQKLSLPRGWMDSDGGDGYKVAKIPCVHPEALSYERKNPQFSVRRRSVFDVAPNEAHAIRTMNIFNKDYFSIAQLRDGAQGIFQSLKPGGIWIVGRTLENDFSNDVTILQKEEDGWQILVRIGNGSEMEAFSRLSERVPHLHTSQ
jgi:hypothetical protein